jgi:sulfate/thiosulfate transport system permease protein
MRTKNKNISSLKEPASVRWLLIAIAILFLTLFLVLPLAAIFNEAFSRGLDYYLDSIAEPDAVSAINLTLLIAGVSLILNLIFGLAAAWAITKFDFKGKNFVLTLLDLPLTISPVIAGMVFILLLGSQSFLGPILNQYGIKIIFAVPGLILATTFVTLPYIVRELIPQMKEHGRQEEEAALSLGANGWQIFFKVTLPNIKWGLLYGVILCNARAIGEFGAVSVVSGHIRGYTNTMSLHIEILYNEYNFPAAFAVSTLLTLLALITLLLKSFIAKKI